MANKVYKVKRVVDFRAQRGQMQFKMRWAGYAKEKDHTWFSMKEIKRQHLQRLVLLFHRWKIFSRLPENKGKTQADFEAHIAAASNFGANMKANCVVVALRNAGKILGLHDFCSPARVARFKVLGKGFPSNMPWETVKSLIDHCNRQQRIEKKPILTFRGKKDNLLKRSTFGYAKHNLLPGVYICGAFDTDGTGHCFALQCTESGDCFYHDPEMGKGPVLYTEKSAAWIKSWNFVIPFKLK